MQSSKQLGKRLSGLGNALTAVSAWPGRMSCWLVILIVIGVLASILANYFRLGNIAQWSVDLPLLGTEFTLNGIAELQWHLFAVLVMFGLSYTLTEDRHIRVDFLSSKLSYRTKSIIDIVGDLVFLLPFCLIIAWLSLSSVEMAYISQERSPSNGLVDRYLVKSVLPLGLMVLFLAGVGRIFRNLGDLLLNASDSQNENISGLEMQERNSNHG